MTALTDVLAACARYLLGVSSPCSTHQPPSTLGTDLHPMGCALTGQVPQMPQLLYHQLSHAQSTLQHMYILMDVAKTGSVVVMLAGHQNSSQKALLGTLGIAIAVRYCERVACADTQLSADISCQFQETSSHAYKPMNQ